jgi:hypothetical protein
MAEMATDTAVESPKPAKKGGADMLSAMRNRLKIAIDATSVSRESEQDDLKFRAASPDVPEWQWPAEVLTTRSGNNGATVNARPTLVINKIPQHVLQVTNDQKQNRPAGKVIPVDDKADIELAQILEGMVRHIEYISDADVAYDTACDNQVTYGEGYFRILTEYCDENSFDQDIKIGRIRNSFSVYVDPMIQDPCGSDAEWAFITQQINKKEYEELYPKAKPISNLELGTGDTSLANWMTEDTVTIAEYFYFENETKTLMLYDVPAILNLPVVGQFAVLKGDPKQKILESAGLKPIKERETVIRMVKWVKTNGYEELETRDWPGKWIPIVRVVGNEFEIDGDIYVSGIVRNAKDAQRMYNYWASQEAEMLALAPKAPFVGYAGQFEGFEDHWKLANVNNYPYLEVNPDAADPDGKAYPLPQRMAPPMPQAGLIQAKMGASDDIKSTTGQYDASLGQKSNESSGIAIQRRNEESDTGTYHYADNYSRAVRYGVRQIVDLIPKIYDTKRIARIIGLDNETQHVEIDPDQAEAVRKIKDENGATIKAIYNPNVGKYDVVVTTGPGYMTKRQQTADSMVQLAQSAKDPIESLLMKYFAIKNMDFPEAQEFVKALKKLLPPGILDDGEDSPEIAKARKVIEQLEMQIKQMGAAMQEMQSGLEAKKIEDQEFQTDIKNYDALTKRLKTMSDIFADQMSPDRINEMVLNAMRQIIPDVQPVQEMAIPEMQMPMEQQPMGMPQ